MLSRACRQHSQNAIFDRSSQKYSQYKSCVLKSVCYYFDWLNVSREFWKNAAVLLKRGHSLLFQLFFCYYVWPVMHQNTKKYFSVPAKCSFGMLNQRNVITCLVYLQTATDKSYENAVPLMGFAQVQDSGALYTFLLCWGLFSYYHGLSW